MRFKNETCLNLCMVLHNGFPFLPTDVNRIIQLNWIVIFQGIAWTCDIETSPIESCKSGNRKQQGIVPKHSTIIKA